MSSTTHHRWFNRKFRSSHQEPKKKVCFFFDEFTYYLDVEIGKKAITLLSRLGYEIIAINHQPSGRAYLSKGFLDEAKKYATANVSTFSSIINSDTCLVGVEPSAILTFRDEYLDLLQGDWKNYAVKIAEYTFTVEDFFRERVGKRKVTSEGFFSGKEKNINT